ncbi:MAG: hypothetical protein V3T31_02925, partial [candidate division Zixibacteria bacterium]
NSFSISLAERFNIQTQQLAVDQPNSVGSYMDNVSNMAAGSSTELMATFFNSVEAYLGSSEEAITAQTEQFFAMAAEELGFSEATTEAAKAQLTSQIENFFDRVEQAISTLSEQYLPAGASEPIPEEIPVTQPDLATIDKAMPSLGEQQFGSQLAVG